MRPRTLTAIVLAVIVVLGVLAWIPIRGILQYRATYPGPVTFVGHADGAFGTEYYRVFMWRAPDDTSPLPPVKVFIQGTAYALSDLNDDLMQSLGGTAHKGGLKDAADVYFQYRFENGRLTWFSLDPRHPALPPSPDQGQTDRFYLQFGDGPPFLLPVSQAQLIQYAGRPQNISRDIAN